MKNILLIFIRNPQLGKVKTRLARTLGNEEALRIYHILLGKTRSAALGCAAKPWLFYSDFIDEKDAWDVRFFHKTIQHPGDLGERMESAFQQAFDSGAQKVVIMGSDCPELTGVMLDHAFELLDSADFVLGPVPDGGYYLIGMKTMEPTVFQGIEWSTETVRTHTIEKIEQARKSFALLPMLQDVDTEADWNTLRLNPEFTFS
jgi:rSAM/selenodomain-associated transferase 1